MTTIEERVDRLESVLEQFMVQTSRAITHLDMTVVRLERSVEEMRVQAEKDREEARRDREEIRLQAERDREEARRDRDRDREEARRDREKDREETRRDREEARRERRELARQLGDISNRLGTIVEDVIAPSLRRMAEREFDLGEIEFFTRRAEKYHPLTNQRREFDVLIVGRKAVLLNETKSTARPDFVKEAVGFLRSGEFFEYFPEYLGRPLIPVFSSLYIPDDIVAYLTHQGIYAVGMGEETMQVLNLDEVRANR